MEFSQLWVSCLYSHVTSGKSGVSIFPAFPSSVYGALGLTWMERQIERSLCGSSKFLPGWLMVEAKALSPNKKEGRSDTLVPERDLGIQMQKAFLLQLKVQHA